MRKPPLIATLLTILSIIILCSLGTWQLKRLQWKTNLVNNLNAAYDAPTDLTPNSLENAQFAFGTIRGTLAPNKAILIGPRISSNPDKKIGAHIIAPLITSNTTYLINLGWTDKPLEGLDLPTSNFQATGLARKPDWNSFTPDNNPDKEEWYKADIRQIAAVKNLANPAPYIIKIHDAKQPRWQPANNHAYYVFFWFSMAGILCVIYWLRFLRSSSEES